MRKAQLFVALLLTLLATLPLTVMADYTPAQARQEWTFTASQMNAGNINFYFRPVTGGNYKVYVNFEDATVNATTTGGGYLEIKYNNGTTPVTRMAWGVADTTIPYYWSDSSGYVFEGNYNGTYAGTPYDFIYEFRGMERYLSYYDEATNTTIKTDNLVVSDEIANMSSATMSCKWLLTAGTITVKLIPSVDTAGIVDIMVIGAVLTIVVGSFGAIGYKKYKS